MKKLIKQIKVDQNCEMDHFSLAKYKANVKEEYISEES